MEYEGLWLPKLSRDDFSTLAYISYSILVGQFITETSYKLAFNWFETSI